MALPSVPLLLYDGPTGLWWDLPEGEADPPRGWLRLSIVHALPTARREQWQQLEQEYTRRYTALYDEAKDKQAAELTARHQARWNEEFAAANRDFHFYFADFVQAEQFAQACLTQAEVQLAAGPADPRRQTAVICASLRLHVSQLTVHGRWMRPGRQQVLHYTLTLGDDPAASVAYQVAPARMVAQTAALLPHLHQIAATNPAHLRDERVIAIVEQIVGDS